jgi:DNA uptake protein ComE-like DNA-binding protein
MLALVVALLFAVSPLTLPEALAQATKEAPAKPDGKAKSDTKPPAKPDTAKGDKDAADKKKAPLDINTASAEELQTIPGIGDAYATYDKVKDQIIARQPAAKK